MFIGKVVGSTVATQKVEAMVGSKLLIVEPCRVDEETRESLRSTGRTLVTVDTVGAGPGDYVLVVQGSSARLTPETKNLPVDAVVVGIIDSVHVEKACVYSKEERETTPKKKPKKSGA